MSKCIICKEDIKTGAKKCIHCDSFQDWRKYLSISNTTLSLIIALISVLSITTPTILKLFEAKTANISVKIIGNSGGGTPVILFTNNSKIPGIVSSNASVVFSNKTYPVHMYHNDISKLLILKDQPRILSGVMNGDAPITKADGDQQCEFRVKIYDQTDRDKTLITNFHCSER